jgi:hypothetical protein
MTRFRIHVLLLAAVGVACGALLGIGHWFGAVVSLIPLAVLAYFAARSEGYTLEAPVYQAGAVELVRKAARVTALFGLGLILIALVATVLTMGIFIPPSDMPKIPSWILAAINMYIPYAGFALLCAGFSVWSGAVFWKNKRGGAANAGTEMMT